jgi:hypothetical protein
MIDVQRASLNFSALCREKDDLLQKMDELYEMLKNMNVLSRRGSESTKGSKKNEDHNEAPPIRVENESFIIKTMETIPLDDHFWSKIGRVVFPSLSPATGDKLSEIKKYEKKFDNIEDFKGCATRFNASILECCSKANSHGEINYVFVPAWLTHLTKCCMIEKDGPFYEKPAIFYDVCQSFWNAMGQENPLSSFASRDSKVSKLMKATVDGIARKMVPFESKKSKKRPREWSSEDEESEEGKTGAEKRLKSNEGPNGSCKVRSVTRHKNETIGIINETVGAEQLFASKSSLYDEEIVLICALLRDESPHYDVLYSFHSLNNNKLESPSVHSLKDAEPYLDCVKMLKIERDLNKCLVDFYVKEELRSREEKMESQKRRDRSSYCENSEIVDDDFSTDVLQIYVDEERVFQELIYVYFTHRGACVLENREMGHESDETDRKEAYDAFGHDVESALRIFARWWHCLLISLKSKKGKRNSDAWNLSREYRSIKIADEQINAGLGIRLKIDKMGDEWGRLETAYNICEKMIDEELRKACWISRGENTTVNEMEKILNCLNYALSSTTANEWVESVKFFEKKYEKLNPIRSSGHQRQAKFTNGVFPTKGSPESERFTANMPVALKLMRLFKFVYERMVHVRSVFGLRTCGGSRFNDDSASVPKNESISLPLEEYAMFVTDLTYRKTKRMWKKYGMNAIDPNERKESSIEEKREGLMNDAVLKRCLPIFSEKCLLKCEKTSVDPKVVVEILKRDKSTELIGQLQEHVGRCKRFVKKCKRIESDLSFLEKPSNDEKESEDDELECAKREFFETVETWKRDLKYMSALLDNASAFVDRHDCVGGSEAEGDLNACTVSGFGLEGWNAQIIKGSYEFIKTNVLKLYFYEFKCWLETHSSLAAKSRKKPEKIKEKDDDDKSKRRNKILRREEAIFDNPKYVKKKVGVFDDDVDVDFGSEEEEGGSSSSSSDPSSSGDEYCSDSSSSSDSSGLEYDKKSWNSSKKKKIEARTFGYKKKEGLKMENDSDSEDSRDFLPLEFSEESSSSSSSSSSKKFSSESSSSSSSEEDKRPKTKKQFPKRNRKKVKRFKIKSRDDEK